MFNYTEFSYEYSLLIFIGSKHVLWNGYVGPVPDQWKVVDLHNHMGLLHSLLHRQRRPATECLRMRMQIDRP